MDNNKRYANRELDAKHQEIMNYLESLDKKVDDGFAGTYKRQDKTNGRVSDLETSRDRTDGALRVVQILLVPILIALVVSFI